MGYKTTYRTSVRAVKILRKLMDTHSGRIARTSICEEFNIDPRTLKRYVKYIYQDVFPDIICEKSASELGISGGNRKFLVIDKYKLEGQSGFQLAPLYLSRFLLNFLEGSVFTKEIENTLELFNRNMHGANEGVQYGYLDRKFFAVAVGPKSYADKDSVINELLWAVLRQNECDIVYEKLKEEERKGYRIKPLTLVVYKQGLYVLADVEGKERYPFFAVERIRSVETVSDSFFRYPQRYKPQEYISGSFGIFNEGTEENVAIEFSEGVVGLVRARKWHPTQRITATEDGGCRLTMQVNSTNEVYTWVLSFGKEAEVLEPAHLRQRIADDIRGLAAKYLK